LDFFFSSFFLDVWAVLVWLDHFGGLWSLPIVCFFWESPRFSYMRLRSNLLGLPLVTQMRASARYRVTNSWLDCSHISLVRPHKRSAVQPN